MDLHCPNLPQQLGLGTVSLRYNYQNAVMAILYSGTVDGETIPSFSSTIARVSRGRRMQFRLDYSLDPKSIPSYSASDVLEGAVEREGTGGKDVVIGIASEVIGDSVLHSRVRQPFGALRPRHRLRRPCKTGVPSTSVGCPHLLALFSAAAGRSPQTRFRSRIYGSGRRRCYLLIGPIFRKLT